MRKLLLLGSFVLAVLAARPPDVQAADICTSMLMPVVQLKQVARGFGHISGGFHAGVDLTAPYGSPVRAASNGVVVFAGRYFGYGNMIDVRTGNGIVTRYAHLSAFARNLRVGSLVFTGAPLGAIGTSGHAHGPHLHFEVRMNGVAVDPKPYLALGPCIVGPSVTIEEAHAPDTARTIRRRH